MAQNVRQDNLFAAEDYQVVYESFQNSNFQAYDYETIRAAMINYIKNNYPEDYNDWISSSEFIALIDLMSFLGHNLAFRIDLNTRENFLSTAERKESVLRLADFLGYNPKRNINLSGLLKIIGVQTSEILTDSDDNNLQNVMVRWDAITDPDIYEQFITVINSAFEVNYQFGTPSNEGTVDGVKTQRYVVDTPSPNSITYSVPATISNISTDLEIVSCDFTDKKVVLEDAPDPNGNLGILYRDDLLGIDSGNTGFFVMFKEGTLANADFLIETPIENQTLDVSVDNINEGDVWVQNISEAGTITKEWTKVDNLVGNNITFNSLQKNIRRIFRVVTRDEDQITVKFADGRFGDVPADIIRVWYRTSAGQNIIVHPVDVTEKRVSIPYTSKAGLTETLTLLVSLQSTVSNSSTSQSIADIQLAAPLVYATQDRMITAQDYSVYPYSNAANIKKIRAINRTHSGHSRYSDINDPTGTFKDLDIFSDDGFIYKEDKENRSTILLPSVKSSQEIANIDIVNYVKDEELINLYYDKFPIITPTTANITWNQAGTAGNLSTGFFTLSSVVQKVGDTSTIDTKHFRKGSLIEFKAPTNYWFSQDGTTLISSVARPVGGHATIWATISTVDGSGLGVIDSGGNYTGLTVQGNGTIGLNRVIPSGTTGNPVIVSRYIPRYNSTFTATEQTAIRTQLDLKTNFGIRYDYLLGTWHIITATNLGTGAFSLTKAGDTTNANLDNSWLIKIEYTTNQYTLINRITRYVFGSKLDVRFFNTRYLELLDSQTLKKKRDDIHVLSINTLPSSLSPMNEDYNFKITKNFVFADGYVDPTKVMVTVADPENDLVPNNPEVFLHLVGTGSLDLTAKTFDKNEYTVPAETGDVIAATYTGRKDLKFQWKHVALENLRIDPSVTNIIETYILTNTYDTLFRTWLTTDGKEITRPLPTNHAQLKIDYAALEQYKASSDHILYFPAKYKILFGASADHGLRAKFKVVKTAGTSLTDNEVRAKVIEKINEFFAIENWDFGETFYFTELSTYIHKEMTGGVASIVIVPQDAPSLFGNLFQITPEPDELFISSAKVADVQIIDQITATNLRIGISTT